MDHRFLIESKLEESTLNDLWEIYCEINNFWNKEKSIVNNNHKQIFISFILNRIGLKPEYVDFYKIGVKVYKEYLVSTTNNNELHQKLFNNPVANIHPYTSAKSMFKQKVINEFITFYLASGGFKIFNPDKSCDNSNYVGYIGGENGKEHPYLTYENNK